MLGCLVRVLGAYACSNAKTTCIFTFMQQQQQHQQQQQQQQQQQNTIYRAFKIHFQTLFS